MAAEQQISEDDLAPAEWLRRHPRSSTTDDRVTFRGHVAIAGPAGELGIGLDLVPIEWLVLESGIGAGPNGLQWAVMPRLRYPLYPTRIYLGLGLGASWGKYASESGAGGLLAALSQMGESRATKHWDLARWYNYEISLDRYTNSGRGTMHLAWGVGIMQNPTEYRCTDITTNDTMLYCGSPDEKQVTFYFVFGYGFSI